MDFVVDEASVSTLPSSPLVDWLALTPQTFIPSSFTSNIISSEGASENKNSDERNDCRRLSSRTPHDDPEMESLVQNARNREQLLLPNTQAISPSPSLSEESVSSSDYVGENLMVLMSLFYQKGLLALTIFEVEQGAFFVSQLHYWPENGECSFLYNLIVEYEVSKILIPTTLDRRLVDELNTILSSVDRPTQVTSLKAQEYAQETCFFRVRILSYSSNDQTDDESHHQYQSPADHLNLLDSPLIVRSTGALISFALKEAIVNELEGASSPIFISKIRVINHNDRLLMDVASYDSLQIFKSEHHPSVSGIGVKKEGVSLFGIMDKTKSPVGRKLLKRWFLSPLLKLSPREARLNSIEFFLTPDHSHIVSELQESVKGIKDATQILIRIRAVRASLSDWVKLFQTLVNSLKISEIIQPLRDRLPVFDRIVCATTSNLLSLTAEMYSTIDFDQSKEQQRLIPRDGYDTKLDHLRHTYNGLEGFLTELGEEELEKLSFTPIENLRCVYYPQIGFQLAIPREECEAFIDPQLKTIPNSGLEFQFLTATFAYFKNITMREADEKIGDIYCDIIDFENMIIRNLEKKILEHESQISQIVNALAELDCLLSLSIAAHEFRFCKPELVEENIIAIEEGRHPIQELCVPQFIPNDTIISPSTGVVKFITGPNFSGKSVYIKQVGLIVFLAHLGSYVPAKSARICVVDRIFTRISSRETISVHRSSFFLDCAQIANVLKNATHQSLALIDEFGKGTSHLDGVAILTAVLNDFLRRETSPKVLLATHCLDLLSSGGYVDQSMNKIDSLEMTVHLDEDDRRRVDDPDVVYLYKLQPGKSSFSHGRHVAQMAGVPEELLIRAQEVTSSLNKGEPITTVHHQENDKLRYQEVVQVFQEFDVESGDISQFLHRLQQLGLQSA